MIARHLATAPYLLSPKTLQTIVFPAPDSINLGMRNPWLDIPLCDYEGHMSSPAVAQLTALADLFEEALTHCLPDSVAILGIAGGNGLGRIDPTVTKRIIGVDIQLEYLEAVRQRHPQLPLQLICADLQQDSLNIEAVRLVHAALIFEHTGCGTCLQNAISMVSKPGYLSVVLQLPGMDTAGVSPTPFSSIQILSEHFNLVDRADLMAILRSHGLVLLHELHRDLPAGKAFWLGIFQRS